MRDFPVEKIRPISAKLSGANGNASLRIDLEPFELSIGEYAELFDQPIRFDGIKIPTDSRMLEGNSFEFPANPEPGYIDGSIYFLSTHSPVDTTLISFGRIESNLLSVEIFTSWVLEYENTGFKNFEVKIETKIEL